jgi:hypothetical protein
MAACFVSSINFPLTENVWARKNDNEQKHNIIYRYFKNIKL